MQFQVSTHDLAEALNDVVLPGAKAGLEGVSLLLLEVDEDGMTVTGSDLDMVVARTLEVTGGSGISFTVGARRMQSICKALPGDTAHLKLGGGGKISITSGAAKALVPTGVAEEFTTAKAPAGQTRFGIPVRALRVHLERVHYAAAKDGARYICMGVAMIVDQGRVQFAATDAKRVALSAEENCGRGKAECILPTKAVERLLKILPKEGGRAEVGISPGWASFNWGKGRLATKLLEGKFPSFEKLLSSASSRSEVVVKRPLLLESVRRAAGAGGGEGIVTLSIRKATEEDIGLLGQAPGALGISLPEGVEGSYSEVIPLEVTPDRDSTISLFSDYLTEPLAAGVGDNVTIKYGGAAETVILDQPEEIMSILSPVRLGRV